MILTRELFDMQGEDDDLAASVAQLESDGYLVPDSGGISYDIRPVAYLGITALYFEARVRNEYGSDAAARFVHKMITLGM